jgi:hypothetical protein
MKSRNKGYSVSPRTTRNLDLETARLFQELQAVADSFQANHHSSKNAIPVPTRTPVHITLGLTCVRSDERGGEPETEGKAQERSNSSQREDRALA